MGAWGLQFDENDDAADWLADFGDSPSWAVVDDAFGQCESEYVEAPDCCQALAASEIVAAGLGQASSRLDANLAQWAASQPQEAAARREAAIRALTRIRDDSELLELWSEDDPSEWIASVSELHSRLT